MLSSLPRPFSLAAALLGLVLSAPPLNAQTTGVEPPKAKATYIILKLDDLRFPTPAWQRTVDFLKQKNVKSSIGIIVNALEVNRNHSYEWIKSVHDTGLVEFWNHGYDHQMWKDESGNDRQEFKGASYEAQKANFTHAQQLAKEKLGFPFHTFGAPFNATDENTLKVLSEDPEMKVFLYGNPKQAALIPNILIMDRTQMNIENPLFVPNAQRVEHDYRILAPTREYFVIQGHPNQWDEARFTEFTKLVEYLISQGATFITPYEYALSHQAKN